MWRICLRRWRLRHMVRRIRFMSSASWHSVSLTFPSFHARQFIIFIIIAFIFHHSFTKSFQIATYLFHKSFRQQTPPHPPDSVHRLQDYIVSDYFARRFRPPDACRSASIYQTRNLAACRASGPFAGVLGFSWKWQTFYPSPTVYTGSKTQPSFWNWATSRKSKPCNRSDDGQIWYSADEGFIGAFEKRACQIVELSTTQPHTCPNVLKFGELMQCGFLKASGWLTQTFSQIEDAGRRKICNKSVAGILN